MPGFLIKEFTPTILFLIKFVGIYVVGNFLYGLYITGHEPAADPLTHWTTDQTAAVLTVCGWESFTEDNQTKPTTKLIYDGKSILAVYEGCNGMNVIIIFVSFLIAFGPYTKHLFWFIPAGILIIHLVNLIRIALLFLVAIYQRAHMYFIHKYFFTAILYIVVFILWVWWVRTFASHKTSTT